MPNEFTVVGENREDASELLVLGTDGKYYGYTPASEEFAPVEPDEHWVMASDENEPLDESSDPELDLT